jgi:hypothetical protein
MERVALLRAEIRYPEITYFAVHAEQNTLGPDIHSAAHLNVQTGPDSKPLIALWSKSIIDNSRC